MDYLNSMESLICTRKAVINYKSPGTKKIPSFEGLLSIRITYLAPRESTCSTNTIKGPNFLECSGYFASFCKQSSRNVNTTTGCLLTVNSHLLQKLEGIEMLFLQYFSSGLLEVAEESLHT